MRALALSLLLLALALAGVGSYVVLGRSSPALAAVMGDVNCGGTVDTVDSLQILRLSAGLSTNAACMDPAGDVDCDGDKDAVDSLRILRHVAGLTNTTPDGCTPIGEATGGALLNEVRFLAPPGAGQFVEIEGGGSPDGLTLVDESNQTFALPGGLPSLGSDEVLLIVFDGGNSASGNVVHASPAGFLDSDSGAVELRDGADVLDRIAWGDGQLGAVPLGRGGVIEEPEAGMTIGRVPGQTATSDRFAWLSFSPAQATPGEPNEIPGVEIALPPDGAIFGAGDAALSWYPVAGASQYHVQVATDDSFAAPLIDQTSADTEVSTGSLNPGDYFWRVAVLFAGGGGSGFGAAQTFTIDGAASSVAAQRAPQNFLGVPYILQRKDTRMLLLESDRPAGDHAWDKPHPDLDKTDPADNHNCVLASLAMLNRFFGGNLSQDRIGYEVRKDRQPGPELDLNYGGGLYLDQTAVAFQLALGVAPEKFAIEGSTADERWDFITGAIDDGYPILSGTPRHAFVVTGYSFVEAMDTRYVAINDPWSGLYSIPVEGIDFFNLWRPSAAPVARNNEPELDLDSDGDGIVDFDETNRFHTKPLEEDTDGDGVIDKEDVKESVFGTWGYSASGAIGDKAPRDWDDDGLPNERDCDSDNDGIKDGDDPDDYSDPPDPPVPAGCLTDFVGSASAVIHVDSGIYTVNVSGLRFQQIETTGPVVHYALTESPAVTWQASGTTYCPPFTCLCSGAPFSGEITLQPADGTWGYGKVWGVLDTNLETHTYSGRIQGVSDASYSYTCPDGSHGQNYFASPDIMYTGNNWIAIAAGGRLDGVNEDPGFYTSAHWEWHLEPAPPQ